MFVDHHPGAEPAPQAPLPDLADWAQAYCDRIEEVQSWGGTITFDPGTIEQVTRLLRLVTGAELTDENQDDLTELLHALRCSVEAAGGRPHSAASKSPPVEGQTRRNTGGADVEPVRRRGLPGEEAGHRRVPAIAAYPGAIGSTSTSQALRMLFSVGEMFTAADAVDRLESVGRHTTRNAVATALSRGEGEYYERVDHGLYRRMPRVSEDPGDGGEGRSA